ncbi:uncharacterized protein PSFLO_03827 [Pseudozyma flocculosa]|uniref:Uncharacterized protein n=1 Tax=Pseudozyma flocculosa TaxID=84751 RepID=A0A5C3F2N0_9BASI|nr:uncharacterized protein PSFLO_03827 [Pseudozyma flocculosa]
MRLHLDTAHYSPRHTCNYNRDTGNYRLSTCNYKPGHGQLQPVRGLHPLIIPHHQTSTPTIAVTAIQAPAAAPPATSLHTSADSMLVCLSARGSRCQRSGCVRVRPGRSQCCCTQAAPGDQEVRWKQARHRGRTPGRGKPCCRPHSQHGRDSQLGPGGSSRSPSDRPAGRCGPDAGSSVSSRPSQGAASGGAQRDGPSREQESSRQRSNGGQFSGGQASSGQPSARPSSVRPSRGGRSSSDGPIRSGRSDGPHRTDRAGNSPSRGTAARSPVNEGPETPTYLRGSQPVVVIPAAQARSTGGSPAGSRTPTPTYPQGSQPVVVIPAAPSRNRRQVQGSRSPVQQDAPPPVQVPDNIPPVLRPLEEPDMELDLPVSSPLDVDAFAVTVSPAALLSQFGRGAYITVASYAKDFDDLEHFSSWIHFGTLGVLFRCHPQYKIPLLERLRGAPQHSKVYKNEHPTAFAMGEPMLSLGIVVDALQALQGVLWEKHGRAA